MDWIVEYIQENPEMCVPDWTQGWDFDMTSQYEAWGIDDRHEAEEWLERLNEGSHYDRA